MLTQNFTLVNENGEETKCELLFAFEHLSTGKHYMVYTDHTPDEFGFDAVFASGYDPDNGASALEAIETEEEWDLVDYLLEVLQDDSKEIALKDELRLTVSYL